MADGPPNPSISAAWQQFIDDILNGTRSYSGANTGLTRTAIDGFINQQAMSSTGFSTDQVVERYIGMVAQVVNPARVFVVSPEDYHTITDTKHRDKRSDILVHGRWSGGAHGPSQPTFLEWDRIVVVANAGPHYWLHLVLPKERKILTWAPLDATWYAEKHQKIENAMESMLVDPRPPKAEIKSKAKKGEKVTLLINQAAQQAQQKRFEHVQMPCTKETGSDNHDCVAITCVMMQFAATGHEHHAVGSGTDCRYRMAAEFLANKLAPQDLDIPQTSTTSQTAPLASLNTTTTPVDPTANASVSPLMTTTVNGDVAEMDSSGNPPAQDMPQTFVPEQQLQWEDVTEEADGTVMYNGRRFMPPPKRMKMADGSSRPVTPNTSADDPARSRDSPSGKVARVLPDQKVPPIPTETAQEARSSLPPQNAVPAPADNPPDAATPLLDSPSQGAPPSKKDHSAPNAKAAVDNELLTAKPSPSSGPPSGADPSPPNEAHHESQQKDLSMTSNLQSKHEITSTPDTKKPSPTSGPLSGARPSPPDEAHSKSERKDLSVTSNLQSKHEDTGTPNTEEPRTTAAKPEPASDSAEDSVVPPPGTPCPAESSQPQALVDNTMKPTDGKQTLDIGPEPPKPSADPMPPSHPDDSVMEPKEKKSSLDDQSEQPQAAPSPVATPDHTEAPSAVMSPASNEPIRRSEMPGRWHEDEPEDGPVQYTAAHAAPPPTTLPGSANTQAPPVAQVQGVPVGGTNPPAAVGARRSLRATFKAGVRDLFGRFRGNGP